jgi:dihydrofolate reductase
MKTTVYIGASLDGFIARKDGNIDWLTGIENPSNDDFGFGDFMRTVDAIVMGRGSFETVLTFGSWPYDRPVFVLSSNTQTDSRPSRFKGRGDDDETSRGPGSLVEERIFTCVC